MGRGRLRLACMSERIDQRAKRKRATGKGRSKASDPSKAFAVNAARLMRDDKCDDVVVIDVRGLSPVTDYIVIGTGTSDRQIRSVLDHVVGFGSESGWEAFRVSGDDAATWLVADFVHVVAHVFEVNARAHYDLEMLWGEGKPVAWERPDQKPRDRARLKG